MALYSRLSRTFLILKKTLESGVRQFVSLGHSPNNLTLQAPRRLAVVWLSSFSIALCYLCVVYQWCPVIG